MSCTGCGKPVAKPPQVAVRYRAILKRGEVFDGAGPEHWLTLRTHVYETHSLLLGGRLFFNDGSSRNFGGWSWSYMLVEGENWTIDDDRDANVILLKYPHAICIPGGTVMDAEMQHVNAMLSES